MDIPLRVLIIEDSDRDVALEVRALKAAGYEVTYSVAETASEMKAALAKQAFDIVISDHDMPQLDAPGALAVLKESGLDIPFIIVSGAIGEENAVALMKAGAHNYVMKDRLALLVPAVQRELREAESRREQKRAEEALRQSEAKIRHLMEITPLPLCYSNKDGVITFRNSRFVEVFGYTDIEVPNLAEWWLKAYPDAQYRQWVVQNWESAVSRAAETGDDIESEDYRVTCKDGNILDIIISGVVIEDNFLATFFDITARKQAENEIKELGLKNQRILNAAGDGIYGLNSEGQITFINPAAAKMLGYDKHELIGKVGHDTFHHTRSDGSPYKGEDCPIYKSFKNGIVHYQDSDVFIRKDGTSIPVEYTSSPIVESGKVIGGVVSFKDITERKQAAEALRESEQRFMDVLYSSPDAVLLIDDEKFVDCNEATVRVLGYADRNEFLKTHPSALSPPTQPDGRNSFEKANEMMGAAFERGFHQFEWEHRRANGEDFPVEVSLTSIVLHGKNVLHCMWRELTERKRAEQKLQNTLESLRKALGTTIQVMVSAVETRDPYTAGHQLRSAYLTRAIATEMGLPVEKIDGIRMAASIHDIGKLSIPAEILSKPTKLSEIEFSLIKEHARTGFEMLKDVESPWPLAEIVHQHHERMDGSGYPRNLKGDDILMEARIMAVADVVESMSSHRPYRPALGLNAAMAEIENNKGTLYDTDVADACLRLFREKGYQLEGV